MSSESIKDELISLAEAAHQHVLYLQELGVDNFEAPPAVEITGAKTKPVSPERALPERAIIETAEPTTAAREKTATSGDSLFGEIFKPSLDKLPESLPDSKETFEEIWADVGNCTRCSLCQGRTNVVHTEGNRKARLMFIGEAPGADEDAQARPFVGRAGQLLTKIIEAIGMKREEVLIGNINRCRPPGNRAPLPDEVAMCKPFLLREIASARPEVIVVMGNTAMKNLLDTREGITRLRGIFQDYKGIKVMPTFHPAYLLRDPSKKRETWEDLKKVRDYLEATPTKS